MSRIRVSGGSPLPSRCDLVLGLIRHCSRTSVRLSAFQHFDGCEQMGVVWIKSRSVLAVADGRLA